MFHPSTSFSDAVAIEVAYSVIEQQHLSTPNGSVAGQQWEDASSSPWLNYWVPVGNTTILHQVCLLPFVFSRSFFKKYFSPVL
jgi:hypothetical protein